MAHYEFIVNADRLGLVNRKRAQLFNRELIAEWDKCNAKSVADLKKRTKIAKKIDLGMLYEGWNSTIMRSPDSVTATLLNDAPHHVFVEMGRRAGARMPPVAVIAAWCGRKLGDSTLGFIVARAIGRRGIPPTPLMTAKDFQRWARQLFAKGLMTASDRVAGSAMGRAR